MRTLNASRVVVAGLVIGTVITWLSIGGTDGPRPGSTGELPAGAPQPHGPDRSAQPREALHGESSELPQSSQPQESARLPGSVTPRSEGATPRGPDDATYSRMLALATSRPDAVGITRKISKAHEQFVLTPDDPQWARQTERALSEFFRSRSANKSAGIEITSIACRSTGCEVQAIVQMGFVGGAGSDSIDPEGASHDPREALQETWPIGPSLKRNEHIGSDLFESDGRTESIGFMVWYSRKH